AQPSTAAKGVCFGAMARRRSRSRCGATTCPDAKRALPAWRRSIASAGVDGIAGADGAEVSWASAILAGNNPAAANAAAQPMKSRRDSWHAGGRELDMILLLRTFNVPMAPSAL